MNEIRRTIKLLILTIVIGVASQVLLQVVFAQVYHPVSLAQANMTFDPDIARGYLVTLRAQGTFEYMVITEIVDLLWIGSMMVFFYLVTRLAGLLLSKRNAIAGGRLLVIAPYLMLVPALDVIENLFSLLMLADPMGFAGWLANAHAIASWVKFAGIGSASVALVIYTAWSYIAIRKSARG